MANIVSVVLSIATGLLLIVVSLFSAEIFASVGQRRAPSPTPRETPRRRTAVLIPAHNESSGLVPTLDDVKSQLRSGDRLLLVADNCTDDTAAVARGAGAEVIERFDPANAGKGYALDFGIRYLAKDPPDILVMIDADCRLAPNALDHLLACAANGRPAQGLYLIVEPDNSRIDHRVAEFAFRVKNWVRPLGRQALKWPCQLTGSCMAFPWEAIKSVNLRTGELVEDLTLGLDLTRLGHPPIFCPAAIATSSFPLTEEGTKSQRQRWEHGHLRLIIQTIPKLISEAATSRNYALLQLALDLAIPPLTLLAVLLSLALIVAVLSMLFGASSVPLFISAISMALFIAATASAWWTFGKDIVPPRALLSLGTYALRKIPLYIRMMLRVNDSQWIRTDRRRD